MCVYTIASGWRLVIDILAIHRQQGNNMNVVLWAREGIDTSDPVRRVLTPFDDVEGEFERNYRYKTGITGPADIWVEADQGGNLAVSAELMGVLYKL